MTILFVLLFHVENNFLKKNLKQGDEMAYTSAYWIEYIKIACLHPSVAEPFLIFPTMKDEWHQKSKILTQG